MWQVRLCVVLLLVSITLVQGHSLGGFWPVNVNDSGHIKGQQVAGGRFPGDNERGHLGGQQVSGGRYRRDVNASWTAGYDWNGVVDVIFTIAQRDILAQRKDRVALADAENVFEHKLGFLKVRGRFHAWEGSLANLTHFRRSGDVAVVKRNGGWEMDCTLTLDDLKLRYERYEFNVLGLKVSGHLEGGVASNRVKLSLRFASKDEGCVSSLRGVELTDLRGLRVEISGLGEFNGVGSAVATWMVKQREKDVVDIVNRVLKREIEKALDEFQCDEYISLLLL